MINRSNLKQCFKYDALISKAYTNHPIQYVSPITF